MLDGKHISIFHKIVENIREQGTVYIQGRYELTGRRLDYLGILASVTVLSMLAALIMSAWLQRAITIPIADIADTAHPVMDTRDFSLRVRKTTEDEIGYLVDAFNNMLAEIGRRAEALLNADRMKDQFLAMLAHELRNPLAPISNALHLLEAAGNRPDVASNARAMMARQLKQLVRLVDDLLDVSRITTGKLVLHKETLELRKVIDNAVEIARPVIESHGHDLKIEVPRKPVYLDADETRLSQVFSNLLNNAAKYTDSGGRIEVRATVHGGDVEVAVIDNGMGISPDVLPNLFNMFTQGSTSIERTQAGLGVGLALAQHLTKMHGMRHTRLQCGSWAGQPLHAAWTTDVARRKPALPSPCAAPRHSPRIRVTPSYSCRSTLTLVPQDECHRCAMDRCAPGTPRTHGDVARKGGFTHAQPECSEFVKIVCRRAACRG